MVGFELNIFSILVLIEMKIRIKAGLATIGHLNSVINPLIVILVIIVTASVSYKA